MSMPVSKTNKKKAVSKKSATKKAAPKKAAPKKAAPKKATSKKAAPKKAAPKKVAPKKVAPKKVVPKKAAPKKAVSKKVAPKKAAPKKAVSKKAAPKKAAPKKKKTRSTFKRDIIKVLNDHRRKILQEVSHKVKSESDESKFEIGDIYDIATVERERELTLILGDRDRAKLSEIEDALDRLGNGSYGECEVCGEPISEMRLRALPFTRSCIECKARHEREGGFRGRFDEDTAIGMIDRTAPDDDDL